MGISRGIIKMEFKVLERGKFLPNEGKNIAYLRVDNWNDYSYYTLFQVEVFDENGKANQSDRAGNNNDWQNLPNTELRVVVNFTKNWTNQTEEQRNNFMTVNNFRCGWGRLDFDNSYSHLSKDDAQLYASKGYELKKENYK